MVEVKSPVSQLSFKSLQKSPSRECILILAKGKEGKTTCALTASEKFAIDGKPGLIDDIGIITFDATGLAYAKAMGYEFSYWIDMSDYLNKGSAIMDKTLADATKMMYDAAVEGKIHTLIVDPISTLDVFWQAELAKSYENWVLTEQLNLKHKRFLMDQLMPIPCNLVLTMHVKKLNVASMDTQKKDSVGLDPEDTQVMDIGGFNGPKLYRNQSSQILPLKRLRGKTVAEDKYYLYPRGVDGIEAGGRHKILELQDKLPADMKEVFRLIKSAKPA